VARALLPAAPAIMPALGVFEASGTSAGKIAGAAGKSARARLMRH